MSTHPSNIKSNNAPADVFLLPDLGEGLPDAEIYEWFIKPGDEVRAFQTIVSMETAKAVVDIPSPQDGVIHTLYGQPGDLIQTGAPLLSFVAQPHVNKKTDDAGTVVGHLEEHEDALLDDFIIGSPHPRKARPRATPSIKLLAQKMGLSLDVITPTGEHQMHTQHDLFEAARQPRTEGFEPLQGVRRAMCHTMISAQKNTVPVTIFDEADLHAWPNNSDITVRIIRAIEEATQKEPALNAWFDGKDHTRRCFEDLHLGIAMDHQDQLFVPVVTHVSTRSDEQLREMINTYKTAVMNRQLNAENSKGATFTLSNFGKFSGRFATPIIVPPMVAILAVGRLRQGVVVDHEGQIKAHPLLPLSLSFDHRAVTGSEATKCLAAIVQALQRAAARPLTTKTEAQVNA